jgi:hypothetical protein
MEIKINLLEAASELALQRMYEPFEKAGYTYDEFIGKVMLEGIDILTYKPAYQEEFNKLYDIYYDSLAKLKINE